ncbi:MAG: hypothetical protein HOI47_22385 [Candidatus Scalindua sp.]|nr:hypothetical protein [Candidatus Scalindua sp.]MBT6229402.1 hypothetical protein [Candidatus Scalindua sp.]
MNNISIGDCSCVAVVIIGFDFGKRGSFWRVVLTLGSNEKVEILSSDSY